MLTLESAKKIGINACVDKLGREFVMAHRDSSGSAYGTEPWEGKLYCYVGVDDNPPMDDGAPPTELILDSTSKFPYSASCNVCMSDGNVEFLECFLPNA